MKRSLHLRWRDAAAAFISIGLVPALLFVVVLLLPIPESASRILTTYSWPLFLAVLLLYFGAYNWRFSVAAASGLTMVLLAISLSFLWHSGYSDDKILGGLLPLRDALDYFNGAEWILGGQAIKVLNEGAAWRPLYPGFLSSLLSLTGRDLQWSLAIQVATAGLCFSIAGASVSERLGAAPAALFSTLLYFFIQPLVGTAYTETLGLALGCLGFVFLWNSADDTGSWRMLAGLLLVLLAVSARAGAFLILPALILWAAYPHLRFSLRRLLASGGAVSMGYVLFNRVYNSLLVDPGAVGFGNFAFTMYGQVNGGAGYHKAFEDLGVRDPAVIMRAAERFFVAHPIGFVVGSAKAYRDFVSPVWGVLGLGLGPVDIAISSICLLLMLWGLIRAIRRLKIPHLALAVAAFAGILLSVPFLPPIDGGIRIYASTMPFVFVLPAIGLAELLPPVRGASRLPGQTAAALCLGSAIAVLTLAVPLVLRHWTAPAVVAAPSCPASQVPFVASLSPGAYVELDSRQGASCGSALRVCGQSLAAYARSSDEGDAALFTTIARHSEGSLSVVFVGNDIVGGKPHVYVAPGSKLVPKGDQIVMGCATETPVKGRPSVYAIQSAAFHR